ncbi:MAG: PIN domain-containing protein [Chloroflexi bacterium]|nr:PIN domain-containing protein [Chloroflexota bacterium]
MPVKYVLDTHTVLWHIAGDRRLGQQTRELLASPASNFVFPAIAVAEAIFVIQARKTPVVIKDLWDFAFAASNVTFYPLDEAVLRKSEEMMAIPEMHDLQIAATALVLQDETTEVVVLTRDPVIRESGLVNTLW